MEIGYSRPCPTDARRRRRRRSVVITGLLALLLAACGGAGEDGPDSDDSEPEAAPDWWRCEAPRLDGRFTFGRAPYGCPVADFGDPDAVTARYPTLIFDDTAPRDSERHRYMGEMHAFLRDVAEQVIVDRKPDVEDAEIAAWQRAVFATAHQESFWAHYRQDLEPSTPSFLGMLRGDGGHGHGLLQLDDRFWRDALRDGAGWRLEQHAIFALDILFDGWRRAPDQPCVSRDDAWRERTRAAYSAYNGGPGQICRWTNPDDPAHAIDLQFADKYDHQRWREFVSEPAAASSLDLACLRAGANGCRSASPHSATQQPLWRTDDGAVCVPRGDGLECLDSLADAACLAARAGRPGEHIAKAPEHDDADRRMLERHTVCADAVDGLVGVGNAIELRRDLGLSTAPGAAPVAEASQGERLQVLDFRIGDARNGRRYYEVAREGERYWLQAGDHRDHAAHTIPAPAPDSAPGPLPATGELWWVAAPDGIALRGEPDGRTLERVPPGTAVSVREVTVRGPNNRIHVRMRHAGETGWLHVGRAAAPATVDHWLRSEAEGAAP